MRRMLTPILLTLLALTLLSGCRDQPSDDTNVVIEEPLEATDDPAMTEDHQTDSMEDLEANYPDDEETEEVHE